MRSRQRQKRMSSEEASKPDHEPINSFPPLSRLMSKMFFHVRSQLEQHESSSLQVPCDCYSWSESRRDGEFVVKNGDEIVPFKTLITEVVALA